MTPELHFAKDAFPLHLLFQRFQRLIDIVVANDDLQAGLLLQSGAGSYQTSDNLSIAAPIGNRPTNLKVTRMRSKTVLSPADAQRVVVAAREDASSRNWAVTIAVVDDAGLLLLLE